MSTVEMRAGEIIHPNFKGALIGLINQEMSFDTAFKLKALIKKIESKIGQIEETRIAICAKYCPKDENGKLLMAKDENGKDIIGSVQVPTDPEQEKAFKEEFQALMLSKVSIETPKIKPESLKDTRVTMNDLDFLEPFLDMRPELSLV